MHVFMKILKVFMIFVLLQVNSSATDQHSSRPSTSQRDRIRNNEPAPSFQWTTERDTHEVSVFEDFRSGFNFEISEDVTEINIFQYFVDTEFISLVVEMINTFHNFFVLNVNLRVHSRLQRWYDVTVAEMYIFFSPNDVNDQEPSFIYRRALV